MEIESNNTHSFMSGSFASDNVLSLKFIYCVGLYSDFVCFIAEWCSIVWTWHNSLVHGLGLSTFGAIVHKAAMDIFRPALL